MPHGMQLRPTQQPEQANSLPLPSHNLPLVLPLPRRRIISKSRNASLHVPSLHVYPTYGLYPPSSLNMISQEESCSPSRCSSAISSCCRSCKDTFVSESNFADCIFFFCQDVPRWVPALYCPRSRCGTNVVWESVSRRCRRALSCDKITFSKNL